MIISSRRFLKLTAAVAVLSAFTLYAEDQQTAEPAPAPASSTTGNKTADADDASRIKAEAAILAERREKTADDYLVMARNDFIEGSYRTASEHALKAIETLRDGKSPEEDSLQPQGVQDKLASAKTLLSKSYYYLALEMFVEAEKSMNAKMFDEAIRKCNEAVAVDPNNEEIKAYADALIKKFTRLKEASDYNDETAYSSDEVDPQGAERQLRIEREMRKGQQFYKTGQWAKARDHFQAVLLEDPYNEMAIDYLRRCFLHLIDTGRRRHHVETVARSAEMEWKSVQSIVTPASASGFEGLDDSQTKTDDTKNIEGKLKSIVFTSLEFEDKPLQDVIGILRERSRELDPDKNGVNILLFLSDKPKEGEEGAAASASTSTSSSSSESSDDDDDDSSDKKDASSEGKDKSGDDKSSDDESEERSSGSGSEASARYMVPYLKVENKNLREVVSLVCDAAGVKFRVEPHAVLIADDGVPLDECELKVFIVEKDVLEFLGSGGDSEGSSSSSSSSSGEGSVSSDQNSQAIKKYFEDLGVPFPANAAVRYDEAANRLVVSNTPAALLAIGEILDQLNAKQTNQVLVQVKFVEVQLEDLEELGFEYVISRPSNNGESILETQAQPLQPNQWIIDNQTVVFPIAPPVVSEDGTKGYTLVYYPQYAGSETVLNGTVVQPKNSAYELGNTVKIPAGASVTLPQDSFNTYYALPLNQTAIYGRSVTWGPNDPLVRNALDDTSAYVSTMTVPASDTVMSWSHQDKDTGLNVGAKMHALDLADSTDILSAPRVTTLANEDAVIKMVTARYYPDEWNEPTLETIANGTVPVFQPSIPSFGDATEEGIVLNVRPQVEDNFTITLVMTPVIQQFVGWTDYSYRMPLESEGVTRYYPNTLKKPIIEARTVETTVVSYDSETIVLGGVIKDRISMVDDQIPILGDIPLIGRLFQSKGRGSEKTSLLIFMTSRLIKPDGSPIRENVERGIPAFRY